MCGIRGRRRSIHSGCVALSNVQRAATPSWRTGNDWSRCERIPSRPDPLLVHRRSRECLERNVGSMTHRKSTLKRARLIRTEEKVSVGVTLSLPEQSEAAVRRRGYRILTIPPLTGSTVCSQWQFLWRHRNSESRNQIPSGHQSGKSVRLTLLCFDTDGSAQQTLPSSSACWEPILCSYEAYY
jgi:hypothetical protein